MSAGVHTLEREPASPLPPSQARLGLELGLAALSIALIFAGALILPLPFWRAQPAGPAPSGQPAASDLGWPAALLALGFAAALCVPFRPYALALRIAERVSRRAVLLTSSGLALVALLIFPGFGSDLFVYLDYERLWTVYGANPLLASPNLHPEDWAFRFVWIPEQPNPYGPLWALVTWPIAQVAGDSLWGWIFGYKLLSLGCYVTCCALVWLGAQAERQKRALVQFAWSPLVLFELLGKAHNDGLMAVSALAAVLLLSRRPSIAWSVWSVWGALAATAGALIKLSGAAVLLSTLLWILSSRTPVRGAFAVVVVGAVSAALYAPFWAGPDTLAPVLFQTGRVVWSPGALLISLLPGSDTGVRALSGLAWLITVLLITRTNRERDLATATALILLATLLLLTTAFFSHYLVPVIGLAALAGNRRLDRLVMALSIGALAAYSVELLAPALPAGWIGSRGYQALGSLVTLGPAALLWLRDKYRASWLPLPRG